ncbi:hypothetical protein [Nakamurella antarctica]|nr:hypothetical protein [Nakamurella antarctica]
MTTSERRTQAKAWIDIRRTIHPEAVSTSRPVIDVVRFIDAAGNA